MNCKDTEFGVQSGSRVIGLRSLQIKFGGARLPDQVRSGVYHHMISRMQNRLFLILSLSCIFVLPGCATRQYSRNAFMADGEAPIVVTKTVAAGQARREAVQLAQVRARDQLMFQILKMKLADGRSVEEVAVKDPYVQAVAQDAVRGGHELPNSR